MLKKVSFLSKPKERTTINSLRINKIEVELVELTILQQYIYSLQYIALSIKLSQPLIIKKPRGLKKKTNNRSYKKGNNLMSYPEKKPSTAYPTFLILLLFSLFLKCNPSETV